MEKRSCVRRAAKAIQDEVIKGALSRIRHKLIVMSGKGGVGKSTVAVNLAVGLYREGLSVGLLDADLHGPSIPGMLGIKNRSLAVHEDRSMDPILYFDRLKVVSLESLFRDKDSAVIWRGPLKNNMIRQFIADVPWGELDVLVVDVPPGTGDEPLTLVKIMRDARAVVVTTPQELALADVRKSIRFCRDTGLRIGGLIENMSGFACPHCKRTIELFKSGGGERLARKEGLVFLGKIPVDPDMVRSGDEGTPVLIRNPDSPSSRAVRRIIRRLREALEAADSS